MKQKKFNKKLAINKTTIANLNRDEQIRIVGAGVTETCTQEETCNTCFPAECQSFLSVCPGIPCMPWTDYGCPSQNDHCINPSQIYSCDCASIGMACD